MREFFHRRILITAISTAFWIYKLFALFPFRIDTKYGRLTRYRFPYIYPTIFLLSMICAISYGNRIVLPGTQSRYSSDVISLALGLMILLYSLTVLFTYTIHYTRLSEIEAIFEECIKVVNVLKYLKIRLNQPCKRLIIVAIVDVYIIPMLLISVIFVRLLFLDTNAKNHYLLIALLSCTNLVASLVPAFFLVSMLTIFYIFRLLNAQIKNVMRSIAHLETENRTAFRVQQQFCDLSDSLDAIAQVHLQLSQLAQRFFNMAKLNLVLWIAYKVCGVLLQSFTVYMYIRSWIMLDNYSLPIQVLGSNSIGTALWLIEISMMASVCSITMKEVYYIIACYLNKIKSIYLRHNVDYKFLTINTLSWKKTFDL